VRVVATETAAPVEHVHRAVGPELGVDRREELLLGQERVDLLDVGRTGPGLGVLEVDRVHLVPGPLVEEGLAVVGRRELRVGVELRVVDRKSTRLNSSHVKISYAVFCLKKKRKS